MQPALRTTGFVGKVPPVPPARDYSTRKRRIHLGRVSLMRCRRVEYRVSFDAGFAYCSLSLAISGDPPWKVCQPYPERRHGVGGNRWRLPPFEEMPIKELTQSVPIVHSKYRCPCVR